MVSITQSVALTEQRISAAQRAALRVGGFTLLFLLVFVAAVLIKFDGDPMVFVNTGERFTQGDPSARAGSDGQFYYYMATEGASSSAVTKMDFPPAFRYQRIFYPALVAALSFGHRALVPWIMLAINVLSTAVFTGLLAYLLRLRTNVSPWYALLGGLWMGSLLSARYGMAEPLALALGMAALVLYGQQRIAGVVVLAGITALTKDVGLILIGGIILDALWNRHWIAGISIALGAILPYLFWAWVLGRWLGTGLGSTQPDRQFSLVPFGGIVGTYSFIFLILGLLWVFIPALILAIIIIQDWRKRANQRNLSIETLLCLAAIGFIVITPPFTFGDLPSLARYSQPLILAALLYVARYHPRRTFWLFGLWGPTILLGTMVSFTTL